MSQKCLKHQARPLLVPQFTCLTRDEPNGRDEGKVDVGVFGRGQLVFGFFRCLAQPLQRHLVFAQVDVVGALKVIGQVVDDGAVEIFTTQVGVAVGGLDLKNAFGEFEDGNIEGAAPQIVDRNDLHSEYRGHAPETTPFANQGGRIVGPDFGRQHAFAQSHGHAR